MGKKIAVVGGGSAGLFCANILSKKAGTFKIDILEKNDRVGKKLSVTGNGTCNISNANCSFDRYYCVDESSRKTMEYVLDKYDSSICMHYYQDIGIEIVESENGKLYPRGRQASAVLDLLRIENERFGVNEICGINVTHIKKHDEGFLVESSSGEWFYYDTVIVCGGGQASFKLGGTNSAYKLLESLGHSSTLRYPTLVAANANTNETKSLRGQKIMAEVTLFHIDKKIKSVYGELLFTEYGLSGPPIFQLTGHAEAVRIINEGKDISFCIDFLPDINCEKLERELKMRAANQGYKTLRDFLSGWLNKQLGRALISAIGIDDQNRLSYTLSEKNIETLSKGIKGWRIPFLESRGFENAQVCAGGIRLEEFYTSLESKICEGLFVAGEVLDAHADSGGFNLQWAWSSAYCVADSVFEKHLQ